MMVGNGDDVPHLRAVRAHIDTSQQPVLYLRADSTVSRAEGFQARTMVEVEARGKRLLVALHRVQGDWPGEQEAAFSDAAWKALGLNGGEAVQVRHPPVLQSLGHLRAKVFGQRLDEPAMHALIRDIAAGNFSDLHLAAFVTACAGDRLDLDETIALTRAMIDVGDRIEWPMHPVVDKHCVGGLPGNRTTLIVVPILAACGVAMPKTSSRAITSPAGTADTMETLAPVDLDLPTMRRVVEREGGCIVWGGAVRLSPADDVLIRVERPLDLDGDAQLVASVLSKKVAAGSQRVLVDMPVGPTAKVRSAEAAAKLAATLVAVGKAVGLDVHVLQTDGSRPVGTGIGPALEARDVLSVLERSPDAPQDLRTRALVLAAKLLEIAGVARAGEGMVLATRTLDSGSALAKFVAICEAQGGMRSPPRARHTRPVPATRAGFVTAIDNRRIARVAKLAGAPRAAAAGLTLAVCPGDRVEAGQPLFVIHAEAPGEMAYALDYVRNQPDIITLGEVMP